MTSNVEIANQALARIGVKRIESFDEASAEARAVRLEYVTARRALLAASHWTFNRRRVVLTPIASDWTERYGYAYVRPADMLVLRRLIGHIDLRHEAVPQEVELSESAIYTAAPMSVAEISVDVEDPTKFPPLFVTAFSWYLASVLAMPLVKDMRIVQKAEQSYARHLSTAIATDANQQSRIMTHEAEWMRDRY